MFHHFHNNSHPKGQGSISAETFENILEYYSKKYNIISAEIFFKRFINKKLEQNDVCITFDDNLKCQYDIALPILEKKAIKAFWFIYTSPLEGVYEKLEIYRYFRSKFFKSFDEFYDFFFNFLKSKPEYHYTFELLNSFDHLKYLNEFSFYSKKDKIFRYTRDKILGEENYFKLMDQIIREFGIELNQSLHKFLWMSKSHLKDLSNKGHILGLHSHTHPTNIGEKSFDYQNYNYNKNRIILEDILGKKISSMSHPCNSYNKDTLEILRSSNIILGFRSNMKSGFNTNLEVPRIDHSEIVKLL